MLFKVDKKIQPKKKVYSLNEKNLLEEIQSCDEPFVNNTAFYELLVGPLMTSLPKRKKEKRLQTKSKKCLGKGIILYKTGLRHAF